MDDSILKLKIDPKLGVLIIVNYFSIYDINSLIMSAKLITMAVVFTSRVQI